MEPFFLGRNTRAASITELNKSLYDDLRKLEIVGNPLETIRALARIGKDVACKLLIIMIDDCNLDQQPDFLLPLADSIGEFDEPKLLLLLSAVEAHWSQYVRNDVPDKSAFHKLQVFGNPIRLNSPSRRELEALVEKLFSLINSELEPRNEWVELEEYERSELLNKCNGLSYRESTKVIIDNLERNIRRGQP